MSTVPVIEPVQEFRRAVQASMQLVEESPGALVTIAPVWTVVSGGAFGIGQSVPWLFLGASLITLVVVLVLARRIEHMAWAFPLGLAACAFYVHHNPAKASASARVVCAATIPGKMSGNVTFQNVVRSFA